MTFKPYLLGMEHSNNVTNWPMFRDPYVIYELFTDDSQNGKI